MRLKKLALTGVVLLAVAAGAMGIVVHNLDARAITAAIADSVKTSTGRDLTIASAAITVLPRPAVVLNDVQFPNAEWGSQLPLARAGRVRAAIDLTDLVTGQIRISRIDVDDATVLLERNREGTGNWTMSSADGAPPRSLRALEIDAVNIKKLSFEYRDGATDKSTHVNFDSVRLEAGATPDVVNISVRATHDSKAIEVDGKTGSLAALMANKPVFPVDAEMKFGADRTSVHGTIGDVHELTGLDLQVTTEIPEFGDYVGQVEPGNPIGPFRGSTRLTGSLAAPVFSGVDITLGSPQKTHMTVRGELSGTRNARREYEWGSSGIDFSVAGVQFGELSRWAGRPLPAWGPYRIVARLDGTAAAPGLHSIDATVGGGDRPQVRLRGSVANVRAASGIDLRIEASAKAWWRSLLVPEAPPMPPFQASARVRDARQSYRIDDLEIKIAESTVSASLSVATKGPRLRISGKASSPLIDLSRVARNASAAPAATAKAAPSRSANGWKAADFDFDLKIGRLVLADGRQVQAAAGRIALDDGRLKATALQATIAGASLKLDGVVAEPEKFAGIDAKLAVQAPDMAELGKFLGSKLPAAGSLQARVRMRGSFDELGMSEIDATAGKSGQNVHVTGQIDDVVKRRGIALGVTANIGDSVAAGRLFEIDVPRLPSLRVSARLTGTEESYVLDDLKLGLGRSALQGRIAIAPGKTRPRITANLTGPLADLSELPALETRPDAPNPLLAADVDAALRISRVVLPDRRALGALSGNLRLDAGVLELKQFAVAVDGTSATLDGTIREPLKPAGLDLALNAKVTHGAGLAALTGLHVEKLPAFSVIGKLTDIPAGYALGGLKLVAPTTTLTGDVTILRGANRLKVTAKATSPLIDISSFIPAAAPAGAAKTAADARLISDEPFPLDVLRAIDADLDLRFETVKVGETPPLGPLVVRTIVADGLLKADPVQLSAKPGQTLSVTGTIDAVQAAWALRIEGAGIDFGDMLTRFGRPGVVSGGITELALQLDGRGKSPAALLGTLNGEARIKVGAFQIHNFAVPLDGGTLIHMFGMANPFLKADPDTDVKCFTARVPIKNGIISSDRKVATETRKYNATMSGTVNLRTEALDLTVTPVVNGEVTTVVRLSGTLGAPVVNANAVRAVAKSAFSLGATVATLGGWWMADTLLKKAADDKSPCLTAFGQ